MKARFRLPMTQEKAYGCLLAANMAEVEYRHRKFVDNDDVHDQLAQMSQWLTSDSPKFGMLLCGVPGNGKSTMLKAFQKLLCCLQIPDSYGRTYGIQIVDAKYIAHLCKKDYPAFLKLADKEMLGIDDMGTEPRQIMDFGNIVTPVIDLLTRRYEEQLFTVITTNLTPAQIADLYGSRIADRLNEMVEKIIYRNSTYRTVSI
ncbi:MAG: hypothetical protein LUD48_03565 [Prevotella sp.]|nr:hypothetical protein [Prevotella sp.]